MALTDLFSDVSKIMGTATGNATVNSIAGLALNQAASLLDRKSVV